MRDRNLAIQLLTYGRVKTSLARAKAVLSTIDRVINFAKKNTVAARREIVKILGTEKLLGKITGEIAPKYKDRNSGYGRLIRLGQRLSDSAQMAILELVEGITPTEEVKIQKTKL